MSASTDIITKIYQQERERLAITESEIERFLVSGAMMRDLVLVQDYYNPFDGSERPLLRLN